MIRHIHLWPFSLTLGVVLLFYTAVGHAQVADTAVQHKAGLMHRVGDSIVTYLTTRVEPKPLGWKAVVIPVALISYGTVSVASDWLKDVNLFGKRWATDNEDPNRKTKVDDYTQHLPVFVVYGLNIAGVRGKHNLVDATLLYAMSSAISGSIVTPVKRWTAEQRPDSSNTLSFPSGHTATAFVSAEFLRQEYKHVSPWIGAGGYLVAAATGYLRMYNNKHWFSDVAAGAGIGILSTRVSYWLYPKLKNIVLGKVTGGTTMVVPTYQNGGVGICMVHAF